MQDTPGDLTSYLAPAQFVDSDHPAVIAYADRACGASVTATDRAVALFYAIRDGIRYDPYSVSANADDYRASVIAGRERGFCVPKAVLLTACARALAIPARLGFADVINHLQSARLARLMATDVFAFHGYTELYLDGRWVKATPAFNVELCQRFGVAALEFDGTSDALLHEFEADGRRHMEYVRDRGTYADLPFAEMMQTFAELYGSRAQAMVDQRDDMFHGDDD